MKLDALAEYMLEIWNEVKVAYVKKYGEDPLPSVHCALFERAHAHIIHRNIAEERSTARSDKEKKPKSDVKCRKCGNLLTVGEKKYCDDNDKAYKCYKCTKGEG